MILEKIVFSVLEDLKLYTEDSDLSYEYITYLYGIKRSKYIRQDLNNFQKTTDLSITQTLCLELESVSVNECGLDFDCETIIRSKQPLPKLIDLHLKSAIISVKPTNKLSIPIGFTTKQKAVYNNFSKFKSVISFLDNDGYIYIVSDKIETKLINCITVTGIFEDPIELAKYKKCCNCNDNNLCFDEMTSDYPLQAHYIDLIKNEIVKEQLSLLRITENTQDKQNNSEND